MLRFLHKWEIGNQSVENVFEVDCVVGYDGGCLILRKEDHEFLCRLDGTTMVLVNHVERLRVEHIDNPNALLMKVDEVYDLMTHLVETLVVVEFPIEQWCRKEAMVVDLMILVVGLLRFPNMDVVMLVVFGRVPLVLKLVIEVMSLLMVDLVPKMMWDH